MALPLLNPVVDVVQLVPPAQVRLGGVLGERIAASEKTRLPAMDEDELLDGYRHRPGKHPWIGEHVGKWLHAASLTYENDHDVQLGDKLKRVAKGLMATQEADGYLGTYEPGKRFTLLPGSDWDVWSHKYCLIGLMAYFDATGDPEAMKTCRRAADLLVMTFRDGGVRFQDAGTHMGMAATSVLEPIVQLYERTHDPRYLAFARQIVASYDQPNASHLISDLVSHRAVDQAANGKAYEMLSNLVGLVELYRATGDPKILEPVQIAWDDIVKHRLYLTGTGSVGEHWTHDDVLPNDAATGETCVTVTWMQLNLQLLRLTGNSKYADQLERSIYNHLLGAQQADGAAWCYYMPLNGRRSPSPEITCCASSGPRGVSLLTTFAYTTREDGVDINLYGNSNFDGRCQLRQESEYPVSPDVKLTIESNSATELTLRMRIPNWVNGASATLNGRPLAGLKPGSYLAVRRKWRAGDTIHLKLPLTPHLVEGRGNNEGMRAVTAGPLVYALAGPISTRAAIDSGHLQWRKAGEIRLGGIAPMNGKLVRTDLALRPFFQVGAHQEPYRVWLRTRSMLPRQVSLFLGAHESQSRLGNVKGSIADGESETFVVTFDDTKAEEDWYAVESNQAQRINRIEFRHGSTFHDGGWFDTSVSKPVVQVQRTKGGPWQLIGNLESYPKTNGHVVPPLKPGQAFEFRCPPMDVYGVRIVGRPSSGERPTQAFSSCAELEAFFDPVR